MDLSSPQLIEKENLSNVRFSKDDVLFMEVDKMNRRDHLYQAMILGNSYKKKVRIIFETLEGLRMVETTVWAATDNNVILKGGIYIPVRSIKEIVFI